MYYCTSSKLRSPIISNTRKKGPPMSVHSPFPSLPPPCKTPSTPKPNCTPNSFPKPLHIQIQHQTTMAQPLHHPNTLSAKGGGLNLLSDWPHLLQLSIGCKDVHLGLAVHAFLVKSAPQADAFPGNNLINVYSKFGRLDDAQMVFDKMSMRNTVTWTSLINGYSHVEDFDSVLRISRAMIRSGEKFNGHTCSVVLKACHCPEDCVIGEQIHGFTVKSGVDMNVFVGTSLASMYLRSGRLEDAEMAFNGMDDIDVRCLNSMILEYGKMGDWSKAIQSFCDLRESGLEPDDYTFTNVISACDGHGGVDLGRQIHGLAIKYGVVREPSVGNVIVTMYARHGLLEEAEQMFRGMRERNLVSWTAIFSGYVKNGCHEKAIHGFMEMSELGISLDSSCLATVVDACAQRKNSVLASQVHAILVKLGYLSDVFVATALVDAYTKCRNLKAARQVFTRLSNPSTASCNAILAAYEHTDGMEGEEEDPTGLFNWMRLTGLSPDSVTCTRLLSLSADQASIAKGKSLHAYTIKAGLEEDAYVGNATISMYAKCGSIEGASRKFAEMASRDSVTWNAMISGYSINGLGKETLLLLEKMQGEGIKPDEITLVSVLQACGYSGLFRDGFQLYNNMETRYGIEPAPEHQVCMVDLLGRAGDLSGAMAFVGGSEFRYSPLLWRALVNVCKLRGDLNFGVPASEHLLRLAPDDVDSYVLVSNLYSNGGMLEEAADVRVAMHDGNMRKQAGCSRIEIAGQVHRFIASGKDHSRSGEIYAMLDELSGQMKENGGY